MSAEEMELTGCLISIRPRTRRGVIEYELRLMSSGGEHFTVYTLNPPSFLIPAIQVQVKAILSKQLGAPKWVATEMKLINRSGAAEVVQALIEEVSRGVYPIVSGRIGGMMFSVPVSGELLSRIPPQLPSTVYCIFVKRGPELRLVEVLSEKEYKLFRKISELILEIEKDTASADEEVRGYLMEAEVSIT